MKTFWYASIVFILFVAHSAFAQQQLSSSPVPKVLHPSIGEYQIQWHGIIVGKAIRKLTQISPTLFEFEMHTQSTIPFSDLDVLQRTKVEWHNGKLRPLTYIYKYHLYSKNREESLTFDWDKMTVTNHWQEKPWTLAIHEGVQNKLSYQLMLRVDIAAHHKTLRYDIAGGNEINTYEFQYLGDEEIDGRLGRLATIKVQRATPVRSTTIWLEKNLRLVLAKIVHQRKERAPAVAKLTKVQFPSRQPATSSESLAAQP